MATFGNSDPAKAGDWVRVITTNTPPPDYSSGQGRVEQDRCPGLVTSLHIEILHASIGSLASPQSKVLGVQYR